MGALRGLQRKVESNTSSILDDPRRWYQRIDPPCDVSWFQRRLDDIAGKNVHGKSIVRIVWGTSKDTLHWLRGDFRYRYRAHTVDLGNGDQVDIPVPRWFLEQLFEPGQYAESWESQRYETHPNGTVEAILPPPPPDGWYDHLWTVAKHETTKGCCERIWEDSRRVCWGWYRNPDESDLDVLAKAVQLRDAEKQLNRPDEPLTPEALAASHKSHFEAHERWEQEVHDNVNDAIETAIAPILKGRMTFLPTGWKETASGLSIPGGK